MGEGVLRVASFGKEVRNNFINKGRLILPPFQITKKEGNEHGKKGDSFGHGGKYANLID